MLTDKKVLIMDDEQHARLIVRRALMPQNPYHFKQTNNGALGLEEMITADFQYDVVIVDLTMPHMNGLTFLQEINRQYPSIYVIMITAYGEVESYLEAMSEGAYEYLHKPIKLDELKSVMNKIFRRGVNLC